MNMETVFKVGDKVYDFRFGWGVVCIFDYDYPLCTMVVEFKMSIENYTTEGYYSITDTVPTLSFAVYDLVKGGFSQERPKQKFTKIDECAVVYVGTYYRRTYSPYLDEGIEWKIGFYHNILNERFFFKQSTSDKVASSGVLLALENPLIHTDTPIYKAADYI
mgnify:CR=1 FL=1